MTKNNERKDSKSISDEIRSMYIAVRAGKDPDTGEVHLTEEQFVERGLNLIERERVEAHLDEALFMKYNIIGSKTEEMLNHRIGELQAQLKGKK